MTRICRKTQRAGSNNPANTNKNVCAYKVAQHLGVHNEVRYLHVINDTKRAIQKQYSMRSVKSMVKSNTVGGARKALNGQQGATHYVVHVDGHVLLLDNNGKTIVDTAPRKRDRRKLLGIWGVYPK